MFQKPLDSRTLSPAAQQAKIQQKGGARIREHLKMQVKTLQTNVLVEELLQN